MNGVGARPSRLLIPTQRANLQVTMFQPTSVNSGALPLPLVFGQKLRLFLALRCLPFGLVVLRSPTSQPRAPRDSSGWLRSRPMGAPLLQAAISVACKLSTPLRCHLIHLRRVLPVLLAIPRALRRTRAGSPPPLSPLHLTWLLASVSKTISAASSRLRLTTTRQSLGRC